MKNGLILPCGSQACAHYRLLQPLAAYAYASGAKVMRSTNGVGTPEEFKLRGFDAVFAQREPGDAPRQEVLHEAFPDVPFIYDFDDLLWQPHKQSTFKPSPEYLSGIDRQVRVASAITVSTLDMAQEVKSRYGRDSIVIPNLMGKQEFRPLRKRPEKMTILWAGSKTHRPDLEQIIPVVQQTHERYNWIFMGDVPVEISSLVTRVSDVSFRNYLPTLYNLNADVGIAPLIDNRFNACKSNLKIMEYGALGMATVASDVGPYKNSRGAMVAEGDTDGWIRELRKLERDTEWRKNVAASRSYAEKYRVDKNIPMLVRKYDEALGI